MNDINFENELTISPNPGSGLFNITLKNYVSENIHVRIVNVIGQEIKNFDLVQSANNDFKIDLSNQPNGVYFVQVKINEHVISKKVIVTK